MAEEPTGWTIMLYITADGTLTNFAVESLEQLNEAVSKLTDEKTVKVAAHFSFPGGATNPAAAAAGAPAKQTTIKYKFLPANKESQSSVRPLVATLPRTDELSLTAPEWQTAGRNDTDETTVSVKDALKAFLNTVYADSDLKKSKHFALVLWGHGPELLLQPPPDNTTGDSNSLYLTPEELREALKEWKRLNGAPLDIIGFDACFMSMFEMAAELKGLARYMVASQDEVPDLSFPYDNLIKLFLGSNTVPLLTDVVQTYVSTYQDCICNNTTQMNPVTLSVLDLDNCDALTKAVKSLADALLAAKDDKDLPDALIEARQYSKDYAGGLYVDLSDFCTNLSGLLDKLGKDNRNLIEIACRAVETALDISKTPDSLILVNGSVSEKRDSLLLVNGSVAERRDLAVRVNGAPEPLAKVDSRSHGISIYLPYLTEDQYAEVQKPLVKGTPSSHSGKGFGEALLGAGTEYLMVARRDLILDTESYYPYLKLSRETGWYRVITEVWTRALMKKVPADLDYHYSAQQSWMNVNRDLETKMKQVYRDLESKVEQVKRDLEPGNSGAL